MRRKSTALFAALILLLTSCADNRAVEIEITPATTAITAMSANDYIAQTMPGNPPQSPEEFAESANAMLQDPFVPDIPENPTEITPETASSESALPAADTSSSDDPLSSIPEEESAAELIINHSTGKYHLYADCPYAAKISDENRQVRRISEANLQKYGYVVCSWCLKHSQDTEDLPSDSLSGAYAPVAQVPPRSEEKPGETTAPPKENPPASPMEASADALMRLTPGEIKVAVNLNTGKYHTTACAYAEKISAENRWEGMIADLAELEALGYVKCEYCRRAETPEQTPPPAIRPEEPAPIPETEPPNRENLEKSNKITIILNTSTMCLHMDANCRAAKKIKVENRLVVELDDIQGIYDLLAQGYSACGICAKHYKN